MALKKPIKKKPVRKTRSKTAPSIGGSGEKTISVRKIANGWVINESWTTPSGQFKSKETFTKTKPIFKIS